MTGGAVCIPRIWSKQDQTLSSWRAAYSCVCSGRTDLNQKLALVEAHTMRRRYAACWSFTHGILWKRVCCSRDLLSRKSATKEGCRWKFPEPPTLACELEAKGHLATPQRQVLPLSQPWSKLQSLLVPLLLCSTLASSRGVTGCARGTGALPRQPKDVLVVPQPPLNCYEGTMLPHCEQHGHEGVALLPSFPL